MIGAPPNKELQACVRSLFSPWSRLLSSAATLRGPHIDSPVLPGDPKGFVWLKTKWDDSPSSQLLEGLELLSLLAYADWGVWKEFVLELWPSRRASWEQSLETRPATVGVETCYGDLGIDELGEVLAMSSQVHHFSTEFTAARQTLLRFAPKAVSEVPVRIRRENYELSKQVQASKLLQLTTKQQRMCNIARSRLRKGQVPYDGLRIRSVEMSLHGSYIDSLAFLQYLAEIAACGVTVDSYHPPDDDVLKTNHTVHMDAMAKLFPTSNQDRSPWPSGVSYFVLFGGRDVRMYPAHLSALRASVSVRSVCFDPRFDTEQQDYQEHNRWMWSWVAYGLFRKQATRAHRIQQLCLHALHLDQAAVDSMAKVINAQDPLVVLFDREKPDKAPWGTISASRFALVDPLTGDGTHDKVEWTCGDLYHDLDVIEQRREWLSVLLPGWGRAFVHQNDVAGNYPSKPALEIQAIPVVKIADIESGRIDPVIFLLTLVGQGIRRLTLTYERERMAVDAILPKIFRACPDLRSFNMSSKTVSSMQVFVDAYASRACRAERLELHDLAITNEATSLQKFFDALADHTQPIAHHLTELTVGRVKIANLMEPTVLASLLMMLRTNRTLRRLEFEYVLRHVEYDQLRVWLRQLQLLDNKPIACRLPLRSKLAFLSVVTERSNQGDGTIKGYASYELDTSVLSIVFQFAAVAHTRRVILTGTN